MTPDPEPGTREFFLVLQVSRGDVLTAAEQSQPEDQPLSEEVEKIIQTLPDWVMEEIAAAISEALAERFNEVVRDTAIPYLVRAGIPL